MYYNINSFKKKLWAINQYKKNIDEKIIRLHKTTISDKMEDEFTIVIKNELEKYFKDKNLLFLIEPNLSLSSDDITLKKINKNNNKHYLYKPDLIICKKDDNKETYYILAIVEFKTDLGWQRDIFKDLSSNNKISYGFSRQYIMEALNNGITITHYNTEYKIINQKEKNIYCKTYVVSGSSSNSQYNKVKKDYNSFKKNVICKNACYINIYALFNQAIRLDSGKNKKQSFDFSKKFNKTIENKIDLSFHYENNITDYELLITDLKEDIEKKLEIFN